MDKMTIQDELMLALRASLANEVCSTQRLDIETDRARVLGEIMMTIRNIGARHPNLSAALRCELDPEQQQHVRYTNT